MGMYSGLRGKVKLKPEVAELMKEWNSDENTSAFSETYDNNLWKYIAVQLGNDAVLVFSDDSRSDFIPYGRVCYMPDDWYNDNMLTGNLWEFCCSLKNYNGTIEEFIDILPHIALYWDLEKRYEEWHDSVFYKSGELK